MYDYNFGIRPAKIREGGHDLKIGRLKQGGYYHIAYKDLEGHMLILGKTGTGKSTLLLNIIDQLLTPDNNVVIIDPHGDISIKALCLSECVNGIFIGSESVEGVKYYTCMNFLSSNNNPGSIDRTSEWVRAIFSQEESVNSGTWGPRLQVVYSSLLKEYIKQNGRNSSLSGFLKLLTNRDHMKEFLNSSSDRDLANFMAQQMKNNLRWTDYISSSVNKLLSLLSNEEIRHMVSSTEESIFLRDIMRSRGNLLVSGVTKMNNSEETVRVFSLLLLLKIWNDLTASSYGQKKSRTYIIVDEAQNIPDGILKTMLSEGRKFGISLILSTQFLSLKRKELTDFIMGNVRNFAVFQISPQESAYLSEFFAGRIREKSELLLRENAYHNFLFWSTGMSNPLTPCSLRVRVLDTVTDQAENLIAISLKRYGRPSPSSEDDVKLSSVRREHDTITYEFREFLDRNGISMDLEKKRGDYIADGYFIFKGREYIVETEISDVLSRGRLISKVLNLSGEKLILLLKPGDLERILEYLRAPSKVLCEKGLLIDAGIMVRGMRRYSQDVWTRLGDVVPVIYDGGNFKVQGLKGLVGFSIKRTSEKEYVIFGYGSSDHLREREEIFRRMKNRERFMLSMDDEILKGISEETMLGLSSHKDCRIITAGDLI